MVIGWKWKCSNTCSGPVLIGRGLNQANNRNGIEVVTFTLCIFECVRKNILRHIGDEDEGGTPVPMPNTEVKPLDAEDT